MDEKIPKMSEMGMLKKAMLKLISKAQKGLLKLDISLATDVYYMLASIHFRLYFQKNLREEVLSCTEAANMATARHGRLVIKALYSDVDDVIKRHLAVVTRGAFVKNIILNADL